MPMHGPPQVVREVHRERVAVHSSQHGELFISELTAEQRNEFESSYNMKIVEETFPNKVVEFKTASKVYAVETDTSVEAVSRDENVSVNQ
jgi:predicted GNAT family acetyltransferase